MSRVRSIGEILQIRSLKVALTVMVLAISGTFLHAQTAAPAPVTPSESSASTELPADPTPTQSMSHASQSHTLSDPGSTQGQTAPWDSSQQRTQDGFQPNVSMGNSLAMGSGIRRGGAGGQFSSSSDRFGAPSGLSGDLFLMGDGRTGSLSLGNKQFGILPSFNLMRGKLSVPFTSSVSTFRLSYREMFTSGANGMGSDLKSNSASAMFSTSDLGNGMTLSIGTSYRNPSSPGSLTGNMGGRSFGNEGHSGAKAAIKLSF